MKRSSKAMALLLAAMMAAGSLTACAGKDASSSSKASSEASSESSSAAVESKEESSSAAEAKTIEFPYTGEEVVYKGFGYDGLPQEDTLCSRAWQDHIGNIKVEWELIPYTDYQTKTQVYLSSGEIPDILPTADIGKISQTFGAEGALLEFNQYESYMPNLQQYRKDYPNMDYLNTTDGKRFAIFGVQPIDFAGENWFANMDMLKKAGVTELPNNLDELLAAMRKVKASDDTSVPFQSYWNIGYAKGWFSRVLGAQSSMVYYDTNDSKFKFGYNEPAAKCKELIQLLADMYKEGLVNSEIQTMSFEQEQNVIAQGKWAFTTLYSNSLEQEIFKTAKGEKIPFDIQPMTSPEDSDGKRYLPIAYQHDSIPSWGIVCSAKAKQPELLAAYMDQVVSPFARDLFNYGVEGETYDIVDGDYVLKDGVDKAATGVGTLYEVWMVGMGPIKRNGNGNLLQQKCVDMNLENFKSGKVLAQFPPVISQFSTEEGEKKANLENTLQTYIDENEAKFIYGLRDMSEWDAYVKEINELVNVDELVAIYTNAATIVRNPERVFEVK